MLRCPISYGNGEDFSRLEPAQKSFLVWLPIQILARAFTREKFCEADESVEDFASWTLSHALFTYADKESTGRLVVDDLETLFRVKNAGNPCAGRDHTRLSPAQMLKGRIWLETLAMQAFTSVTSSLEVINHDCQCSCLTHFEKYVSITSKR